MFIMTIFSVVERLFFPLIDENPFYVDDWCVATLVQGVCFRALGRHDEAERCFQGILEK